MKLVRQPLILVFFSAKCKPHHTTCLSSIYCWIDQAYSLSQLQTTHSRDTALCRVHQAVLWGPPAPVSPLSAPSPRPPAASPQSQPINQIQSQPLSWQVIQRMNHCSLAIGLILTQMRGLAKCTKRVAPQQQLENRLRRILQTLQSSHQQMTAIPTPSQLQLMGLQRQHQGRMLSMALSLLLALPRRLPALLMALGSIKCKAACTQWMAT